jgi:5-methylcytosine-specific restriction endonuclease McrA
MIVYVRPNGDTPLYQVAGSNSPPMGAEKALREAHSVHGGACFYCKKELAPEFVTIDHAEAKAAGGGAQIQNLLLACQACNRDKADMRIELFDPDAGREWLGAVLNEIQRRLART